MRCILSIACLLLITSKVAVAADDPLSLVKNAKRILFLGDSITAGGGYVAHFDAWVQSQPWPGKPQVINCGLPSETISGLSEEGHAGGKFPRPDLFERLDRVLALVKPDLVLACYGINCGIYQPFDQERFARYQQGWQNLKAKVEAADGQLIVITPPFYDDLRAPKEFSYNAVLDRYSQWLVEQRDRGWPVIDLHTAMTGYVKKRRDEDRQFTLQPDGVHPNANGQWYMAKTLIAALGDEEVLEAKSPAEFFADRIPAEALPLFQQRMATLRDAYVAAAGHKRPGVSKGVPLDEATKKAAEITAKIVALRQ